MTRVIEIDYETERAASRRRRDEETKKARLEARALVLLRRGWTQSRAELEAEALSNYPNITDEEREAGVREAMRMQVEGRGARRDAAEVAVNPPERPIRWPSRPRTARPQPVQPVAEAVPAPAEPAPPTTPPPADSLPASHEQQEASMADIVEPIRQSPPRKYSPEEKAAVFHFALMLLDADPGTSVGVAFERLGESGVQMPKGTFYVHWARAREAYAAGERAPDFAVPPEFAVPPSAPESTPDAAEAVAAAAPDEPGVESRASGEAGGVLVAGVVGLTTYVTPRGSLNAEAAANGAMRVQLDLRTGDPGLYSILVGVGMRALLQPEVARV